MTRADGDKMLQNKAEDARRAITASEQMRDMMREYVTLETEHAARLQRLAERLEECVNRIRKERGEGEEEQQQGDEACRMDCVDVMDQVVTFLVRFGAIHRQLGECLNEDLFEDWTQSILTQKERVDVQTPEMKQIQAQLNVMEDAYHASAEAFQAAFEDACTTTSEAVRNGAEVEQIEKCLEEAKVSEQRLRDRSPSKAMQYAHSLKQILSSSRKGSVYTDPIKAAASAGQNINHAEQLRQQCCLAHSEMHRLQVRHARLSDSLAQEYQCIQSDCFSRTINSIRKFIIHISAFTSNLQYDATQLFNHVEKMADAKQADSDYLNVAAVPPGQKRSHPLNAVEVLSNAYQQIVAMGFVMGRRTYLRDSWNMLDFVVVVTSLITALPGVPNVSAIRTIRVLRPLRSLSVIPGMRKLISALLKALPALANVLILQMFVFAIFGILGIQLFGGNMNRRCRLTEYPVLLPIDNKTNSPMWPVSDDMLQEILNNSAHFRCVEGPTLDDGDSMVDMYTKETSPWKEPVDCFWPIDSSDERLCGVPSISSKHQCSEETTCGADYDTYGNPRFRNARVMDAALHNVAFNWGYSNFDNIGAAVLTIFQAITLEGWTVDMYMVMDASDPLVGSIFFLILIVFAAFFVMNLTLAVISDEFNVDETEPTPAEITAEWNKQPQVVAMDRRPAIQESERPIRFPWLFGIVSHPIFSGFIMLAIVANTTILALDHYPMPPGLDSDLEIVNFGLSCVFMLEMVLKLIGLGLRQYARDKFNVFDAFVVITGLLETIATPPSFMSSNVKKKKGAVSALRSFRLSRVFKLARNWRSLRELLQLIARAVASIANFGVLLFLFIYIYALIGLQIFGNTMRFDDEGYAIPMDSPTFWEGELPRNNFDTLLWSMITVFQVITGENWNSIMYDVLRSNGMIGALYFVSLIILGNFILMNLFLALLLDNFSTEEEEEPVKSEQEETSRQAAQKVASMKVVPLDRALSSSRRNDQSKKSCRSENSDEDEEPVNAINLGDVSKEIDRELALSKTTSRRDKLREKTASRKAAAIEKTASGRLQSVAFPDEQLDTGDDPFVIKPPPGNSLFLFSDTNRFRIVVYQVVSHPWFDNVILGLIVLSSVSLAVDNPLSNPNSTLSRFLKRMDNAFAILFLLEMLGKIISLGMIRHKGAYLRNSWNVLDCIIVITSIIMLIAESSSSGVNLKSLRSLRGLRTFRPLRMISRRPGLKLVVNALFEAIPAVLNVLFVCALFFLIFSIVAVNYLKGTFSACSGDVFDALSPEQKDFLTLPIPWLQMTTEQQSWFVNSSCAQQVQTPPGLTTSKEICECWNADWEPVLPENFDNVGMAMLTFFEISTTEGWADVMMAAMDSTSIDMQPIRDNTLIWGYFFILFMMVGSFFVVNLFVGIIIDNFNSMKAKLGGEIFLTEDQKKWIEAQKAASRVGPIRKLRRPNHHLRGLVFDIVKRRRFEWFIMICIIVNTVLMAVQYFGQPTVLTEVIGGINEAFAVIFSLEAVLKIIAYGRAYFVDKWNQFDLFVVAGTIISAIIEVFTGASVRSLTMLVRVFRVTRIIRLVKSSKSVQQILLTLYIALPGLSNITSILFLMLFIYATMGVQLFAKVALGNNIDPHANFQDFYTAFLLLMRSATGEAWNNCMHDFASRSAGCVDDPPYNPEMCGFNNFDGCIPLNGCGNPIAIAYFCSFTLLVTYVMLNLTIAVILESFSQSHEDEEPLFEPELLEEFQTKWADIDLFATGYINVRQLRLLMTILEVPLGRPSVMLNKAEYIFFASELDLPMYEGNTVYFKDVLLAMTREMVKDMVDDDPEAISDMTARDDDMSNRRPREEFQAHEYFAVCAIQRGVKDWLKTKRQLEKEFMDEYRNKIKKPSGRPKKVRDARVYTTG
ncbi:hypothetical protein Poli38472_007461 [Pythium oligandrum]|uniref:Ion transport domain-containing protein n=1 Tax=Pythium oligandrum TaxID=41045 RepID=A0A8K1CR88_PYTOL|nr:hypothetical protein Poli38472_007461 [Pythium oligandrum]|eukprot:TMW67789.1 hypothetical protein Poli38472_007461 [Pythium oligandrum]